MSPFFLLFADQACFHRLCDTIARLRGRRAELRRAQHAADRIGQHRDRQCVRAAAEHHAVHGAAVPEPRLFRLQSEVLRLHASGKLPRARGRRSYLRPIGRWMPAVSSTAPRKSGSAARTFTSAPPPSRRTTCERIWHVESNLTDYSPLFTIPQAGRVDLGNLVNGTYTSHLHGSADHSVLSGGQGTAAAVAAPTWCCRCRRSRPAER